MKATKFEIEAAIKDWLVKCSEREKEEREKTKIRK